MKNFNIFKLASPLLLLSAMSPAMATDVSVPLNFTTLPVITINPIRDINFGPVLNLTAGALCTMKSIDAANGTLLSALNEGADVVNDYTATTPGVNYAGLLTGSCAGSADGTVGIYEISSFSNANISVSITQGTATEIAFTPSGYVTDLVEGVNPAASTFQRKPLVVGTPAVANASEAITAQALAGTNRVIIGGTIANQVGLSAGTPYATDFNLNVVYQ